MGDQRETLTEDSMEQGSTVILVIRVETINYAQTVYVLCVLFSNKDSCYLTQTLILDGDDLEKASIFLQLPVRAVIIVEVHQIFMQCLLPMLSLAKPINCIKTPQI